MNYKEKWDKALGFEQYLNLVGNLIDKGLSTGPSQSEELLAYSKLNYQRMQRIYKTFKPTQNDLASADTSGFQFLMIITEGWCGDAAQIVPVAAKFFETLDVEVRCILRDENTDLIDAHLTNNGRSIPILLFLNESFEVLSAWGPRPKPVQQMVMDYKNKPEPKDPYSEFSKEVQLWYAKDKQRHMIEEWSEL